MRRAPLGDRPAHRVRWAPLGDRLQGVSGTPRRQAHPQAACPGSASGFIWAQTLPKTLALVTHRAFLENDVFVFNQHCS